MPTNYQARVKQTKPPTASRALVDAAPCVPGPNADAAKASAAHRLSAAHNLIEFPPAGAKESPTPPRTVSADGDRDSARRDGAVYLICKRLIDIVLGSVLFVLALPIILIAAVAIRVNTPGSPFFFQTRLGKNGKPFKIFKLRGMYVDARTRFPHYYDYSTKRDLEFCFHHEEDPRVTSAGRFLRKSSIDELPNLWNVVCGDMSLVGPRPEIPEVLALYGPYRNEYLSVKPGITCTSKCTGRDRLTKRETIEFDIDYVRRRDFKLDFKILWLTFRGVVLRRDVF